MQQIELTEEHKKKLLEMCKVLFPEWDEHIVTNDGNNQTVVMFTNYVAGSECGQTIFHWFEFVFTHIVDKIIYLGSKRLRDCQNDHYKMLMEMMKLFYQEEGTHPVDCLYEEFIKSKS